MPPAAILCILAFSFCSSSVNFCMYILTRPYIEGLATSESGIKFFEFGA